MTNFQNQISDINICFINHEYSGTCLIQQLTILLLMSISSIRQRKLFKNNNKSSLQKLLTDSDSYEKQQTYHLKTENSDHRDSYSSRPTLQCNLTRQLTLLENKVSKQEAVAEKCFEEMETLDAHYQQLITKQNQKYEVKKKQLAERIKKQQERNKKTHQSNLALIDEIIEKMLNQAPNKQNSSPDKRHIKKPILTEFKYDSRVETTNKQVKIQKTNIQIASQFMQMIKFEKAHRQIRKLIDNRNTCTENGLPQPSQIEETLVLEIKPVQEQRQSQSILLDDSFIN